MKVKRLRESAIIPMYAKALDSGFDLFAAVDTLIEPGETVLVQTGLAFEIPSGYEMQVRPKSGITLNTKLRVQLGTVDAGYRGEVGVIVDNIYREKSGNLYHEVNTLMKGNYVKLPPYYDGVPAGSYLIREGDKIAQGVLAPVAHTTFEEADELAVSERGMGGFGSTGIRGDA